MSQYQLVDKMQVWKCLKCEKARPKDPRNIYPNRKSIRMHSREAHFSLGFHYLEGADKKWIVDEMGKKKIDGIERIYVG